MESTLFRTRILHSLFFTLAILAGVIVCLVLLYQFIQTRTARIIEYRALANTFEEEKSTLDALVQEHAKLAPFFSTVEQALVPPEQLYRVVEAVENAGIPLGLSIAVGLESQAPVPASVEGARYVIFSARFDGTYDALRQYLLALEALPVFIDIDSLSMQGQAILTGGTISLRGKIYLQ